MNFKISVILLHLFTTTLPITQHSSNSLSVLATNVDTNDAKLKIESFSKLQTKTTATIVSTQTCNDRFCYKLANETTATTTTNTQQKRESTYREFEHLKSSSILYGILKIASEREPADKCYQNLIQIYNGVHRKEIWAIKGKIKSR